MAGLERERERERWRGREMRGGRERMEGTGRSELVSNFDQDHHQCSEPSPKVLVYQATES